MVDQRQHQYLEAMGIRRWVRRDHSEAVEEPVVTAPAAQAEPQPSNPVETPAPQELPPSPPPAAEPATMDGPPPMEEPPPLDVDPYSVPPVEIEPEVATADAVDEIAGLDWEALQQRVSQCQACPELVANRSQTVFGVGNRQAELMVIGEAPGADEDRQGEPFVGRAGQLLNAMLQSIGFKRETVYIANILKCRPPNNRDPSPEEAGNCRAFLRRQIALIQPRLILVVGRIAAQNLLATDQPLGKLRGRAHTLPEGGIPVQVTYHPAYLLRSPQEKRKAWEDLCAAKALVEKGAE